MKFENGNHVVTEWEDDILFDFDDPDFHRIDNNGERDNQSAAPVNLGGTNMNVVAYKVSSNMSLLSVHGPQYAEMYNSLGRSSISVSSSLSDLVGSPLEISVDNVLTIEELRAQMGSCFTCGVSWTDDHVSLDCGECGGYSLERPCPLCDGQCGVQWKRDFTMSHASGKARWQGVCPSYSESVHCHSATTSTATAGRSNTNDLTNLNPSTMNNTTTPAPPASCAAASQLLAQELCARLEQLSASAKT